MTYDDILETLNVRLRQGRLERTAPAEPSSPFHSPKLQSNPQNNSRTIYPTNPHLQNSYIYNKYFKKEMQSSSSVPVEPMPPMTPEEYKQYRIQKQQQDFLERERVKQIKPTKMLYSNGTNTDIVIKTQHAGNFNRMFRFPRN